MSWRGQPCSVAAGDVSRLPPAASLRALVTTSDSCALFNWLNQNHGVHDPYQVCILTSSPWWCLIPFKIFKTPLLEIIWPIILCICLKDIGNWDPNRSSDFPKVTQLSRTRTGPSQLRSGLFCHAMQGVYLMVWRNKEGTVSSLSKCWGRKIRTEADWGRCLKIPAGCRLSAVAERTTL